MSSINVRDRDSKYANKIGMLNYGDSVNRTGIGKMDGVGYNTIKNSLCKF